MPDVRFSDHRPLVCDFTRAARDHAPNGRSRMTGSCMNTAAPAWKLERDADGIAWLTLDKPGTSTNVLVARHAATSSARLLRRSPPSPPRGVVIRSGKPSGFIAGADIKEFTALQERDRGVRD